MTAKNLFIAAIVLIILAMGGCFGSVGDRTETAGALQTGCYGQATAQLSPQWAGASTLDRAAAAFSVIGTCEGNQP